MKPAHPFVACMFVIVFGMLSGCNSKQKLIEENELRSLLLQYHEYHSVHQSGPANLEEFTNFKSGNAFLKDETSVNSFQSIKEGKFVFYWNYDVGAVLKKNETVILAHEKNIEQANVLVGYASGAVARISRANFDSMKKAGQ